MGRARFQRVNRLFDRVNIALAQSRPGQTQLRLRVLMKHADHIVRKLIAAEFAQTRQG